MRRFVIGVDPGSPIAMAIVSPAGNLKAAVSWEHVAIQHMAPNSKKMMWVNEPAVICNQLRLWIDKYTTKPPVMIIEGAAPRPGEGLVSACKYVGSQYMLRGIAAGMGLSYQVVAPNKWKRDLNLTGYGEQAKEVARAKALATWPMGASLFSRKLDHNRAEAALLALWGAKHGTFSE